MAGYHDSHIPEEVVEEEEHPGVRFLDLEVYHLSIIYVLLKSIALVRFLAHTNDSTTPLKFKYDYYHLP